MKTNHTRILALILAVMLALSILPANAYAASDTGKDFTADVIDLPLDIDPIEVKSLKSVVWNFRQHGWSGVGLDGTQLDLKAYYGGEILCKNKTLTYRAYSHYDDIKPVSAKVVRASDGTTVAVPIGLENRSTGTGKLGDGLYWLDITFSDENTSRNSFYVISGKPYAVDVDTGSLKVDTYTYGSGFSKKTIITQENPAEVDQMLQDWIAKQGVTPENSLDVGIITYQYWDNGAKYRCDTQRWAQLAHEICPEAYDSLADSVKVALLHDWMVENLSYDKYLTTTLDKNAKKDPSLNAWSRNFYYNDHSGKYSVWNTRTGVCIDFSNILTIMCRELGIPCNVMVNRVHAWNIVWLDGKWHVFDLTASIQRKVYGLDTSKVDNADEIVNYDGFDEPAKTKFSQTSDSIYSLNEKYANKYNMAVNGYGLYTKESIVEHMSKP